MTEELIAGKYIVERELGRGASGTVLLVKHKDLNVRLALKLLRVAADDEELIASFKREAEVLFRFNHVGSSQVRDFGTLDDGTYFMATDFCAGSTVRDALQNVGHFDVTYSLRIISQLLSVLEAAHERGIVHRDIKPENIMLERNFKGEEVIKVLDFGVAHLLELDSRHRAAEVDSAASSSAGTPAYMSPEQILAETVIDGRCDIYATGVFLYELLTGRVPFQHEDLVQVLVMHVTQPVPPLPEGMAIPADVATMVNRALAKQPQDRFSSAAEFKRAVEDVLSGGSSPSLEVAPEVGAAEELPLEEELIDDPAPLILESPSEQKTKVLIIDDDEALLEIISMVLESGGYEVYTSALPTSIHSFLFTNPVDLVITDIQMPGLSGTKVCKLIKSALPELKIVFLSNLPDRDIESLAEEFEADAYMSKSRTPGEWLTLVADVLGTQSDKNSL